MNIGIIGAGKIAISNHIPAFQKCGHNVIALADTAPGWAEQCAKKLGIPDYYEDYHEIISRKDIEVVSICTPTYLHAKMAVEALEAGKHVYLEKPPAFTEAEMQEIYDASIKNDRILFVGSNTVLHSQYTIAKNFIDSGRLGNVYAVKVIRTQKRNIPGGWAAKKEFARGFAITERFTHNLDTVLYMLGDPKPLSVTCVTLHEFSDYQKTSYKFPLQTEKKPSHMETEEGLMAIIQLEGGRTLLAEIQCACNAENAYNITMYGDKAGLKIDLKRLYWDETSGGLTLYEEPAPDVFTESDLMFENTNKSHMDAIAHFMDCVEKGVHTLADGKRALLVMKIVDALFASSEQNGRQIILQNND